MHPSFSHQFAQLSKEELSAATAKLTEYVAELKKHVDEGEHSFAESSLLLPNDQAILTEAVRHGRDINPDLVLVIGIGGPHLASRSVWEALPKTALQPHAVFVSTIDPVHIAEALKQLEATYEKKGTAHIFLVSKSGTTTETIANYGMIVERFKQLDDRWQHHMTIISGKDSPLTRYAAKHSLTHRAVPDPVGGRFSVFSHVGLTPLAAMGVNAGELLEGARETISHFFADFTSHSATISAATLYAHHAKKRVMHNTFFFAPQLEFLGKWYRQLIAESLGKDGKGITPLVSIGTTDLHSMAQLYLAGPDDKFTTFVRVLNLGTDYTVSAKCNVEQLVPDIEGKSANELLQAIYEGVTTSYAKQKLPFLEIALSSITPKAIGAFMQTKMIETMLLAALLDVNAFDQPAVELYKEETRRLLG